MQYDVIIIGSGLAGLAASAKLSREGKKVLLIEQHNIVGGCATTFKRKGYTFEVSLHELNGLSKNEHLHNMYQDLNVFENLTFLKIPEFYRWIGAGMDIVIPDDADQMKDILAKKFPHEEKGIHKYFKSINKIREEVIRLPNNSGIKKLLTPFFPLLYPNVANELLPGEKAKKLQKKIEGLRFSPSLLNVYIGFKTTLQKFGVEHYSTVVFDKSCKSQADVCQNFKGDFNKRNFIFVDYGQVDSKLAPEGKTVGSICTADYLSDWESMSDEGYKSKKKEVAEILIIRLNKIYPGIKDAVDFYEVGTAKTIKRYTMNPGGSVYGFAQIPSQAGKYRLSQESPIENLYFASAWTEPGGGFGAALGSEYMVANKILKRDKKKANPIKFVL